MKAGQTRRKTEAAKAGRTGRGRISPSAMALARLRKLERDVRLLQGQAERSQRRADKLALLSSVARRLASVLEPEKLLQQAAQAIQARMNYSFVAVVVLDHEGVLVGRWAGRDRVRRASTGRTQGPAGGIIGRAIRKRAPQVVADVGKDPDYHRDVEGTRSEMVVPLIDEGDVVGALDYQSDRLDDFDLDDVAAGETLADFLVVALRNARLFEDLRRARA